MANKRVTDLNELLYNQVSSDDFFLISDVSAVESKKIRASQLRAYASNTGSFIGTLTGTASYALSALSSSWAPATVSSSYASTSSVAIVALTSTSASNAVSSSYSTTSSFSLNALTASYAATSSVQYVTTSSISTLALSSSFLIFVPGVNNGTSSFSLSASYVNNANTSSFLLYTPGTNNGSASYSLTSSVSTTSSYLNYNGGSNGTASFAVRAGTGILSNTASVAITTNNSNIYREFSIFTASLSGNTASFGWMQFTGSQGTTKVSMEAWGDVSIPLSSSLNTTSKLQLQMQSLAGTLTLDASSLANYYTAMSASSTGSIICNFILKGQFTVSPDPLRMSGSVCAFNGLSFYTGSRQVQGLIRATTDSFVHE